MYLFTGNIKWGRRILAWKNAPTYISAKYYVPMLLFVRYEARLSSIYHSWHSRGDRAGHTRIQTQAHLPFDPTGTIPFAWSRLQGLVCKVSIAR